MEIDNELKEILNPGKAALLVWDVQNMLVRNIFNTEFFLSNTRKVISQAREMNIPVIFSKINPLPERFESPVRKYFFKRRLFSMTQFPDGLDLTIVPSQEDLVIPKNTASMFVGTNFGQILRNAGRTTIIITGIATEIGVESTARDAVNRELFPVIVTDAVSSMNPEAHNRSLENLKNMMILVNSEEITGYWKECMTKG